KDYTVLPETQSALLQAETDTESAACSPPEEARLFPGKILSSQDPDSKRSLSRIFPPVLSGMASEAALPCISASLLRESEKSGRYIPALSHKIRLLYSPYNGCIRENLLWKSPFPLHSSGKWPLPALQQKMPVLPLL